MNNQIENRIIILPFISEKSSNEIKELEYIIIQGLDYKFSPFTGINIIDLNTKTFPSNIKPENDKYLTKDLETLAINNNSKYALIGQFDFSDNNLKIIFTLYNMQISEVIDCWESNNDIINLEKPIFTGNITALNNFLSQAAFNISEKINFELDDDLKKCLGLKLFKEYNAFLCLVKAKRCAKSSEEKIDLLNESIKSDSTMEFAYYELAKIYKKQKKYDEAINYYNKAIEKTAILYHKAVYSNENAFCNSLNNNNQGAIENWENSIEFCPKYLNSYMNLALKYEDNNMFGKAEYYFIEYQKRDPSDCRTYLNLARLYSKTGNWLKAIDQYKTQLDVNPQDAWSHSNIGNCFLQVGKNKDAKTFFYKTIDLDPDGEAGIFAKQILESLEESTKRDWWKFWKK